MSQGQIRLKPVVAGESGMVAGRVMRMAVDRAVVPMPVDMDKVMNPEKILIR